MPVFKGDREFGSVDGDLNAKVIMEGRREPEMAAWLQLAQALVTIGSAIAYGLTDHHGWLAFLILSVGWMVVGAVSQLLHQQMTWILIIERRCQLLEQDMNDIERLIRDRCN